MRGRGILQKSTFWMLVAIHFEFLFTLICLAHCRIFSYTSLHEATRLLRRTLLIAGLIKDSFN
jgi:hypothetical protein